MFPFYLIIEVLKDKKIVFFVKDASGFIFFNGKDFVLKQDESMQETVISESDVQNFISEYYKDDPKSWSEDERFFRQYYNKMKEQVY